jgi:hypothetical protein
VSDQEIKSVIRVPRKKFHSLRNKGQRAPVLRELWPAVEHGCVASDIEREVVVENTARHLEEPPLQIRRHVCSKDVLKTIAARRVVERWGTLRLQENERPQRGCTCVSCDTA